MKTLSLDQVITLKKMLSEYGCTLHMHDACGGQSFTMELSGRRDGRMDEALEQFAKGLHAKVRYADSDRLSFVIL